MTPDPVKEGLLPEDPETGNDQTNEGESSQWARLQQVSIIRRTQPMVLRLQQDGVSSEDRSLVIQVTSEEVPREDIEESPPEAEARR